MFNYLLKGVLSAVALKVLDDYRVLSSRLFKIESAKSYLHGVQVARRSAIGLMRMGLVIGFICIGVLLFHAGLLILLPWTVKAKAIFSMCMGLAYVALGGAALRTSMNERTWLVKSGAAEMLKEAAGRYPMSCPLRTARTPSLPCDNGGFLPPALGTGSRMRFNQVTHVRNFII